jgi:hypothetical protein
MSGQAKDKRVDNHRFESCLVKPKTRVWTIIGLSPVWSSQRQKCGESLSLAWPGRTQTYDCPHFYLWLDQTGLKPMIVHTLVFDLTRQDSNLWLSTLLSLAWPDRTQTYDYPHSCLWLDQTGLKPMIVHTLVFGLTRQDSNLWLSTLLSLAWPDRTQTYDCPHSCLWLDQTGLKPS